MSEIALNLDKLNESEFGRFERELEVSKKIERYHKQQPNTELNRTHSTATFFMRETLAQIINKQDDKLSDKLIEEQKWN